MWTCSECEQQHEDQFDVCWKCDSSAEMADAEHLQLSVNYDSKLPSFVLPDFSYYSLPFLLCGMMVCAAIRSHVALEPPMPVLPVLSVPDMVLMVVAGPLFYMPVAFVFLRHGILSIMRRQPSWCGLRDPQKIIREIFMLPVQIGEQYPWFRKVYYASFGLIVVVPAISLLRHWLAI